MSLDPTRTHARAYVCIYSIQLIPVIGYTQFCNIVNGIFAICFHIFAFRARAFTRDLSRSDKSPIKSSDVDADAARNHPPFARDGIYSRGNAEASRGFLCARSMNRVEFRNQKVAARIGSPPNRIPRRAGIRTIRAHAQAFRSFAALSLSPSLSRFSISNSASARLARSSGSRPAVDVNANSIITKIAAGNRKGALPHARKQRDATAGRENEREGERSDLISEMQTKANG